MNVWVNAIVTVDTVQGPTGSFAHFRYNDDDWHLVRRDAGSLENTGDQCWHPADDNLRGTAEYGLNDQDPLGIHTFSVPFANLNWNRLLLASGSGNMWLVITKEEMETCWDRMENHAGGSTWFPDIISSSGGGASAGDFESYQVTQYCREGVSEDPWLSVGEHPDLIVYGEGGWCGGHWGDDAPTFGGSNVWIDSIDCTPGADCGPQPPPFNVVQGPNGRSLIHQRFDGRDWYLVRRDAGQLNTGGKTCDGYDPTCWDRGGREGDNCWHPTDDNLAGTDQYGEYDTSGPTGTSTFSIPFAGLAWSEILLASGDMSMYVIMARESVEECSLSEHNGATANRVDCQQRGDLACGGGQWHPRITASSESDEYNVVQYCRNGHLIADCSQGGCRDGRTDTGRDYNAEDPWISVGHHQDNKLVYGEGMCNRHWDNDAPVQGGMNVWVDSIEALDLVSTTATVSEAVMAHDNGDENRESGATTSLMFALNGGENFVKFRTGGGPGYTVDLTLDAPTTVRAVSTMVRARADGASGFAGLEVSVSTDGGSSYTSQYLQQRIFGAYDRDARCFDGSADCETLSPDFRFDRWTAHSFPQAVDGVTNIRLHTGYADQNGDACMSFDAIRIDTPSARVSAVATSWATVASAAWESDAGEDQACDGCAVAGHAWDQGTVLDSNNDNRETGAMADIANAIFPQTGFVRFRTGSADGYKVWLALAAPANIAGVSIMVNTPASAACESPITERGCASAVAAAGLSQGGCGYDFVGD